MRASSSRDQIQLDTLKKMKEMGSGQKFADRVIDANLKTIASNK